MNEATATTNTPAPASADADADAAATSSASKSRLPGFLQKIWAFELRLIRPFLDSFLPKPHYLEDEVIQQTIGMAGYRLKTPSMSGAIGTILFVAGIVTYIPMRITDVDAAQMISAGLALLGLFFIAESIWGWLAYHQWQFIVTNKRYILVTPDPDRTGFADAIYLKRGKIQVLDTNFSRSPVWGLFQILTGSRDVMLSMGGYEFYETGAKVKGGLRFPDVLPEDIRRLEELIFG